MWLFLAEKRLDSGVTHCTFLADRDGNLTHAEMTHKDCTLMMGPESAEMGTKSPSTLSGSPVSFFLCVDDVDGFFHEAKADGAGYFSHEIFYRCSFRDSHVMIPN
jgi:uncharacterized glyoxalase superfamily protein PhnB